MDLMAYTVIALFFELVAGVAYGIRLHKKRAAQPVYEPFRPSCEKFDRYIG